MSISFCDNFYARTPYMWAQICEKHASYFCVEKCLKESNSVIIILHNSSCWNSSVVSSNTKLGDYFRVRQLWCPCLVCQKNKNVENDIGNC